MKRSLYIFYMVLAGTMMLYSCSPETTVSTIRLSHSEVVLSEGEDTLLTASVEPSEYSGKVSWESMDSGVAEVSPDGRVTAVSGGRTFVLAKAGGVTKGCAVTVKTDVKSITLEKETLLLDVNGGLTLKYTTVPETVFHTKLMWESSDESVVIASEGLVRAEGAGTAVITVWSEDNPEVKDQIEVTVARLVTSITLSQSTAVMYENKTLQLTARLSPADAEYPELTWRSSDENVATVDDTGMVTSIHQGAAKIIVEAVGGVKAECNVTVREPLPNPEIDESVEEFKPGNGYDGWEDVSNE